jgi:hypothetical protein
MNELIRNLYGKAVEYTEENAGRKGQKSVELMCADKFAELIVQECIAGFDERISTRYQGSEKDNNIAYGMEIVVEHIKQHFGVEE